MQIGTNYCYHLLLATLRYNRKKCGCDFSSICCDFSRFLGRFWGHFFGQFFGTHEFQYHNYEQSCGYTRDRFLDKFRANFWTNFWPTFLVIFLYKWIFIPTNRCGYKWTALITPSSQAVITTLSVTVTIDFRVDFRTAFEQFFGPILDRFFGQS